MPVRLYFAATPNIVGQIILADGKSVVRTRLGEKRATDLLGSTRAQLGVSGKGGESNEPLDFLPTAVLGGESNGLVDYVPLTVLGGASDEPVSFIPGSVLGGSSDEALSYIPNSLGGESNDQVFFVPPPQGPVLDQPLVALAFPPAATKFQSSVFALELEFMLAPPVAVRFSGQVVDAQLVLAPVPILPTRFHGYVVDMVLLVAPPIPPEPPTPVPPIQPDNCHPRSPGVYICPPRSVMGL